MGIEAIFYVLTAVISVGISYGITKQKIKDLESQVSSFRKDHDLLVELNTKIDLLLKQKKL